MEQLERIFEHEEFGKIRAFTIDGKAWFVGKDVALALGYSNPRDALKKHVPAKFKKDGVAIRDSIGREQYPTLISEGGLYKLVMRSNLEKAEEFSDWVCEEVLPSIRQTGSYSVDKEAEPVAARRIDPFYVFVYVLLLSDGTVKIGHSGKVRRRVAEIKRQTGLTVLDLHLSLPMSREEARFVEWSCHEKFSSRRVKGELFSVDFETACAAVDEFVHVAYTSPFVSRLVRGKILADLASKTQDPSLNKQIISEATNLIVGVKVF